MGVADTKWVSFKPANAGYSIEGNIKFCIPTSGNSYFDLRELRLRTLVRIVQGNGHPFPPAPNSMYVEPPDHMPNSEFAPNTKEGQPNQTEEKEDKTSDFWQVGPVAYLANSLWDCVEVRFNVDQ